MLKSYENKEEGIEKKTFKDYNEKISRPKLCLI